MPVTHRGKGGNQYIQPAKVHLFGIYLLWTGFNAMHCMTNFMGCNPSPPLWWMS